MSEGFIRVGLTMGVEFALDAATFARGSGHHFRRQFLSKGVVLFIGSFLGFEH